MKGNQLADVYGQSVQKQMDQDMADMCGEMARTNSHARNIKVTPAYEEVDIFKRHQIEQHYRLARQNGKPSDLIYPDDPTKPKPMVVLPNE